MNYRFLIGPLLSGGLAGCGTDTANAPSAAGDYTTLHTRCEVAVAGRANVATSEAEAVSTVPTNTGTLTKVILSGAVAPWNCRADSNGNVDGVEYSQ